MIFHMNIRRKQDSRNFLGASKEDKEFKIP